MDGWMNIQGENEPQQRQSLWLVMAVTLHSGKPVREHVLSL